MCFLGQDFGEEIENARKWNDLYYSIWYFHRGEYKKYASLMLLEITLGPEVGTENVLHILLVAI